MCAFLLKQLCPSMAWGWGLGTLQGPSAMGLVLLVRTGDMGPAREEVSSWAAVGQREESSE